MPLADLLPTLASLAQRRGERVSLAELAREAGTSPSTFQRAFSRLVGESPKQFTRRLQLESAALAVITSDASVLDIALASGFDSHEGFTRAFTDHFACPPREFRQRHAHLADDAVNAALVHQLGPCIGLFRTVLASPKDLPMNYDITIQSIPEATFLYQAARCSHADIAKTLGPIFGRVFGFAMQSGLELRSPPTTLYVEWGPGSVSIHAGVIVGSQPASVPDDLLVATLPAGEAAITMHTGSYDSLSEAHAAVEQFLDAQSRRKSGAAREVYITDPGEVPDPAQWKTQIIWPL